MLAAYSYSGSQAPYAQPPFAQPPSLLSLNVGSFAPSSAFGVPPPRALPPPPPVAMAPAEYGATMGAGGGGGSAPLERVLSALRQERVLSDTQLADLGVSAPALKSFGIEFDRYLTNQVFVSNVCRARLASSFGA